MTTRAHAATPSTGPEGSDVASVAGRIENLLDDDGHFNPDPDTISRGHPDYDADSDARTEHPGRDDRGRFRKGAGADDEAETVEATDEVEDDARGDDRTEDTTDGDTDDDLAAAADDEQAAEQEDTATIETVEQLAEALEVPLDDLRQSLQFSFKAADEDVTVTLAELQAGYQKDADYRRQTAQHAETVRAAESEYGQRMNSYNEQNLLLGQQFQVAEQLIGAELSDPRLAALRDADPAEWTARREEIGQRIQALHGARQQAAANYDQFRTEQLGALRDREMTRLKEAVPDWSPEVRTTAGEAMRSLGYSEQEVGEVLDHRMIVGAVELANLRKEVEQLRQEKAKGAESVKRVRKEVPKTTKPGKPASGVKVQRNKLENLRRRAAKTGRIEDAAKVIESLL